MKAIDISESIFWTHDEVAAIGKKIYDERIRSIVETPENIGKMLTLDVETGEYGIDLNPAQTILDLKQKHPLSRLFTLRIGYQTGVSFGGSNDRVKR
jgi:hypothetical protein